MIPCHTLHPVGSARTIPIMGKLSICTRFNCISRGCPTQYSTNMRLSVVNEIERLALNKSDDQLHSNIIIIIDKLTQWLCPPGFSWNLTFDTPPEKRYRDTQYAGAMRGSSTRHGREVLAVMLAKSMNKPAKVASARAFKRSKSVPK